MRTIEHETGKHTPGLLIYYASIWLYFLCGTLLNSMLGQTALANLFIKYGTYTSIFGLVFCILIRQKMSIINFMLLGISLVVSVFIYYRTSSSIPLLIFLCLFGAEGSDSHTIGRIYLSSSGVVVLLSVLLSLTGVTEDRLFYNRADTTIARHSFGMTYVTIFAAYVFFLFTVVLYLRRNKIKWIDAVLCLIMSAILYVYCNARFEAVMLIVLLISVLMYKKLQNSRIFRIATVYSFVLSCIGIYGLQKIYSLNTQKLAALDVLFTNRLTETAKVLSKYGFKLFGQSIIMQGNGTVNFDPVVTKEVKLEVKLPEKLSSGLFEWSIK